MWNAFLGISAWLPVFDISSMHFVNGVYSVTLRSENMCLSFVFVWVSRMLKYKIRQKWWCLVHLVFPSDAYRATENLLSIWDAQAFVGLCKNEQFIYSLLQKSICLQPINFLPCYLTHVMFIFQPYFWIGKGVQWLICLEN